MILKKIFVSFLLILSLAAALEKKVTLKAFFDYNCTILIQLNFNTLYKTTLYNTFNTRLFTCIADYEGLNDICVQAKLFYRGASGKYQPFLINLDFNACDASRYFSTNKLLQRVLSVFDKFDPSFRKILISIRLDIFSNYARYIIMPLIYWILLYNNSFCLMTEGNFAFVRKISQEKQLHFGGIQSFLEL